MKLEDLNFSEEDDDPEDNIPGIDPDLADAFQLLWDTLEAIEGTLKVSRTGKALSRRDHKKLADLAIEIEEYLEQWKWTDDKETDHGEASQAGVPQWEHRDV